MLLEPLVSFVLLANAVRHQALVPDLELSRRAEARAELLCATGQWSHAGWIKSFDGLAYSYAGENLAKGFTDASSTEAAWLASPTHRANILNPHYAKMGIGQSCNI